MKRFAIIVAGGTGKRFGSKIPKQFVELAGKPVMMHSIEKFAAAKAEIIVVLPAFHILFWKKLCQKFSFKIPHLVVEGGKTRTDSVRNGLKKITGSGVVAVHDAVRPLVKMHLIEKSFLIASQKGNAIPAIDITDSMRQVEGKKSFAVERKNFKIIQTPQCFHIDKLKAAYIKAAGKSFSDDATLFEFSGETIFLEEGDITNIKITEPQDLVIAENLIAAGIV